MLCRVLLRKEPFIIPPDAKFALLIEPGKIREYLSAIRKHGKVEWAFLITNSSEAFQEMAALLPSAIPPTQRIQLYRDYLGNFSINMIEQ